MTILILKLFSESQLYLFTTRLSSSSNKLICAIEQSYEMFDPENMGGKNVHLSQL